ncbi:recombinase family protein [Klebsiella pneumoniae]|uniref:recombinase family protein n=1 Tax=Klebsiella pneumoniae TaxID=573 RepID=UPI0007CC786B|nr:DNA-invertase hin [Klebsiella pneumoniae]SVL84476.1 DNA-invertase hin [Klebsiella pneumoniae]
MGGEIQFAKLMGRSFITVEGESIEGDAMDEVLVAWKLDRLQARGVNFRSLTDSIDTSTPAGRFFFHVMSALAEMERELIVERTRAGLAAAREQGRVGGRRRVMTEVVVERCRRMLENGATRQQIADVIGVGVKTIYKYFPAQCSQSN